MSFRDLTAAFLFVMLVCITNSIGAQSEVVFQDGFEDPTNTPPVADAGSNQNVSVGDTVQLNGSGSSDLDEDSLTYQWDLITRPTGSNATLNNSSIFNPTFVADLEGGYTVELVVNDSTIDSDPDTATVTASVLPAPEIIDFNPKSAPIGTLITITGNNLSSGNPTQVTLSKQGGGTTLAPVANSDASTITITIPTGAATGKITVTVNSQSDTSDDDLNITATSNFSLDVGPVSAAVIQGQSTSYAVELNSDDGFNQLAALAVSGLPSGVTATFSPQQIGVGQTALLTVNAPPAQPILSSELTVSASASVDGIELQDSVVVTLDVQAVTTSFMGRTVVDDAQQTPLEGVTVTLLGLDGDGIPTGCTGETTSDAAGNFVFTNLPTECTGEQLIRYNGSTVTGQPGDYAGVDLLYTIIAGQVTESPVLIHLPRVDNAEIVCIEENAATDIDYVFTTIPNLSITVYAGTSFAPHPDYPSPVGVCAAGEFPLIAVDVPVDRLPDAMPPDPTAVEPFIVAFQPANAVASQPVAVSFPNLLNTRPGTNMELTTLDPTKGVMVIYGTGTVSVDGTQIVPDFNPATPGRRYGLVHFDWHGPRVPPPPDNLDDPTPDCGGPATSQPADLSSGIEVIRNTDLLISGLRGSISMQRIYRTLSLQPGPFGIGSSHNYGYRLDTNNPQTVALINLVMPDGNRFPFALTASGTYTNTNICKLRGAVLTVAVSGESDLRWKNGTVYHFIPSTAALGSILETITDSNGNVITLNRNPGNDAQITEIIDPVGRKLTLSYDGANRIIMMTDPLGRRVDYTYNAFGTLETVTDPLGGVTRYDYSAADQLTQVTDARGVVVVQNAYNADGRVIQQTYADTGVLNIVYTLANQEAGAASPVLMSTVTDPLGKQMAYRFNPLGYVVDVTDAMGQVRVFDREPGTNLLLGLIGKGQCDECGDSADGDVSFTYDANGNLLTRTDALGYKTNFTYEPVFNKPISIADPLSNTTNFTYDGSGNVLTVTDARSNTTTFAYDANGLALTVTDPTTAQWDMAYDAFGNLTSFTDPLANVAQIQYDVASRPIRLFDALGRQTTLIYDHLDQITDLTDARGTITEFDYDAIGNLLSVTDARGNTTSFIYDAIGRLETRIDSLGNADIRVYNLNGKMTAFSDRRGQTSSFTYDVLNRLVGEFYADGGFVFRSFDSNSRLILAIDSISGAFASSYDLAGRLLSESGPHGAVTYIRDALGRVSQRQVVGQSAVGYNYDAAGNQESVTSPAASVTYTYDNRNLVSLEARSNGVDTEYTYDPLGRLLNLVHSRGATLLDSQSYVYDALGNIIQKIVDVAQPLTTQPSVNAYDILSNRLTQWGDRTYTHDDNGNRLTETDLSGTTTYAWDARNRLRSLTQPTGEIKTFEYDFVGNLIEEVASGIGPASSRTYVLDDLTNIAQLTDNPGQQLSILTGQGIDQHLAVTDVGGTSSYGITDQINSTTQTVDDLGASQDQYFYEPFGETSSLSGAYPFQFTGRVPISDTFYHFRARYYDSGAGQFISEDPIGFDGGDINHFRYVVNNPINFNDPSGLRPWYGGFFKKGIEELKNGIPEEEILVCEATGRKRSECVEEAKKRRESQKPGGQDEFCPSKMKLK